MAEENKGSQAQPEAQAQQEQKPATPAAEPNKSENPSQEQTIPYARFKEVNDKLKALEDAAAKAADEGKKAEEKRLEEQQQWQKLAEARGKELTEAKGKAADYDRLADLVGKQLKTEIDAWPEKVKGLFPTDEMPVLEMLEWAERFRPLALEMSEDKTPPAGNGRRPAPISPANVAKADEKQRTQWRQGARQRWR